jgi:hypothetical protein
VTLANDRLNILYSKRRWRITYNEGRRHGALESATPAEFARRCFQTDAIARPQNPQNSDSAQYQNEDWIKLTADSNSQPD